MSGNNVRASRTDHQKVAAVSDVRSLKSGLEEDALNDILKNLSICSKNAVQDTADEKDRRTSEGDLPEPIGVKKQKGHETILAHPFRLYDEPIQPKIAALAAQTSPYQPSAKSSYFDMFKGKKVSFKDGPAHQLIVPSIQGDLVLRQMKEVYPRPFLSNLMDFLLTTKPRRDETVVNINMDVYLWSSAMPRNVKNMLDRFLSSWRRELLGTWTRDNLDLDPMDYLGNPKTWKDLMKLLDHLKERRQPSFTDRRLPRGTVFTLDNVALIEDSFSKARLQPLNHLPITEFTIADYENTMRTLRRVRLMPKNDGDIEDGTDEDYDSATDFDGPSSRGSPKIDIGARVKLLRLLYGGESTGFYIKYLSGSKSYRARGDVGLKMDAMLLAVIGIIFELQDVDSIPVWMASGGLMPPVDHTFTGTIASRGWAYVVQIDNGSKTIPIPKLNIKDHVVPATLPYHEEHPKWYDSPIHVLYWLRRGFLALDARAIDVEHGMR